MRRDGEERRRGWMMLSRCEQLFGVQASDQPRTSSQLSSEREMCSRVWRAPSLYLP